MEWEIRRYDITRARSAWVTEEPILGNWYVGANVEMGGNFVYGELAEYTGAGTFMDEYGQDCDMRDYQYLIEQPSYSRAEHFNGIEE